MQVGLVTVGLSHGFPWNPSIDNLVLEKHSKRKI